METVSKSNSFANLLAAAYQKGEFENEVSLSEFMREITELLKQVLDEEE